MTALRFISLPAHGLLELLGGMALLFAPFALGFGPAGTVLSVALGVLVVGLALSGAESLPVAAHLAFDHALVVGLAATAVVLAVAGDDAAAAVFAAGAALQLLLTATTRYSRRR